MARKKSIPSKPKRGSDLPSTIGVIYSRYSSHNQREVSIEQQEKEAAAYADELGITIVERYSDKALTGKNDKRPDFQRMMRDAIHGKFQFVISWKSNRIGRNMMEAMINEARLNDLGVRVLYVEEDFDDTAAGRFAARSMMNVNQFYSENMAEDIKRGLDDNAEKCLVNGACGFGFKKGPDGRFALDPPRDAIAREIFSRVAAGDPFVDIQSDLNARGIKTATGKEWNRSSFHRLLKSERYRGVYSWGDIRKEGGIPRIVSDELWYKVQEVLATKKNAQGRHRVNGDYPLTGKLFCGKCKSPMTGVSGTSRNGQLYFYYTCQKKRIDHLCDKENVQRDQIEYAVAKAIRDYLLTDETIAWVADQTLAYYDRKKQNSNLSLLEDELADKKKAADNLVKAIEQGIVTATTRERLLQLEAEQASIKVKISEEKADMISISRDDLISGIELYRNGDINSKTYQAKLFDTFLRAAYVYDDDLRIVFTFAGKKEISVPLNIDNPGLEDGSSCVRLTSPQLHQFSLYEHFNMRLFRTVYSN